MSNSSRRHPRRLFVLIALAGVLLALAAIASLSIRLAAPASMGQATLESATDTATPRPPRRLRATMTVMPAAPTRRITRTPAPTSTSISLAALLPTATPTAAEIFTCTETTRTVLDGMWSSRVSGGEERYLIYLPPCYEPNVRFRYPTIYLLHGINSDDTFWESLGVFAKMDDGLRADKFAPALIVSVDGSYALYLNTSGGPGSYEAQIVGELVPTIDRLYRTSTNPTLRAIGGISRGGV